MDDFRDYDDNGPWLDADDYEPETDEGDEGEGEVEPREDFGFFGEMGCRED